MEARCAEMRQRLEALEDRLQVLSHQLEVEAGSANRQLVFFGLEKSSGIFRIPWPKGWAVPEFFERERHGPWVARTLVKSCLQPGEGSIGWTTQSSKSGSHSCELGKPSWLWTATGRRMGIRIGDFCWIFGPAGLWACHFWSNQPTGCRTRLPGNAPACATRLDGAASRLGAGAEWTELPGWWATRWTDPGASTTVVQCWGWTWLRQLIGGTVGLKLVERLRGWIWSWWGWEELEH